ncbi:hypothetical protein P8907_21005 [Bacillus atrophaeus]|nr:hypothetical protein [Bacillus atrophaeus]MEC0837717.1 hypothetical protein [Bacillus atrophaeus]MEC0847618.1 hypothetical protein [Bacillus atrophaeus]MEC0849838.1 hypothetical protein [Bacillus atrophaeus]MEC0866553.1 hypothetical protein [Bacillus atrophaeus]MEC0893754.1 hypothetical protein [Bacillus atrophaeus]
MKMVNDPMNRVVKLDELKVYNVPFVFVKKINEKEEWIMDKDAWVQINWLIREYMPMSKITEYDFHDFDDRMVELMNLFMQIEQDNEPLELLENRGR